MLVRLLMGLMAEVIFDSAAARGRSYEAEVDRYLEERGLTLDGRGNPARAR